MLKVIAYSLVTAEAMTLYTIDKYDVVTVEVGGPHFRGVSNNRGGGSKPNTC